MAGDLKGDRFAWLPIRSTTAFSDSPGRHAGLFDRESRLACSSVCRFHALPLPLPGASEAGCVAPRPLRQWRHLRPGACITTRSSGCGDLASAARRAPVRPACGRRPRLCQGAPPRCSRRTESTRWSKSAVLSSVTAAPLSIACAISASLAPLQTTRSPSQHLACRHSMSDTARREREQRRQPRGPDHSALCSNSGPPWTPLATATS